MHPSQHLRRLLRAGIVAGGGLLALAMSQTHALAASTSPPSLPLPATGSGSVQLTAGTGSTGTTTTVATRGTDGQTTIQTNTQTTVQTSSQTSSQSGTVDQTGSVSTASSLATRGTDGQTTLQSAPSTTLQTTIAAPAASGLTPSAGGQSGATSGSASRCGCPTSVPAPQTAASVALGSSATAGTTSPASATVSGSVQLAAGTASTSHPVTSSGTAAIGGTELQTNVQTNVQTTSQSTTTVTTSGEHHPDVTTGIAGDVPAATTTGGAVQAAVSLRTTARAPTTPAAATPSRCACREGSAGTPPGSMTSGASPTTSDDRVGMVVALTTGAVRDAVSSWVQPVPGNGPAGQETTGPASDVVIPGSAVGMAGDGRTADRGCGCIPVRPVLSLGGGSRPPATGAEGSAMPAIPSIPCPPAAIVPPGRDLGVQPVGIRPSRTTVDQAGGGLIGCDPVSSLLPPPAAAARTVIVLAGHTGSVPATSETAAGGWGGRPSIGTPGGASTTWPAVTLPQLALLWRAPPSGVTRLPQCRGTSPPG